MSVRHSLCHRRHYNHSFVDCSVVVMFKSNEFILSRSLNCLAVYKYSPFIPFRPPTSPFFLRFTSSCESDLSSVTCSLVNLTYSCFSVVSPSDFTAQILTFCPLASPAVGQCGTFFLHSICLVTSEPHKLLT